MLFFPLNNVNNVLLKYQGHPFQNPDISSPASWLAGKFDALRQKRGR